MIVSHKHKFIFRHNPKVGGTSIRSVLSPYAENDIYWGQTWLKSEHRVVDLSHLTASQSLEFLEPKTDNYFAFGFYRDPMDRFVSSMAEFMKRHHALYPGYSEEQIALEILDSTRIMFDWRFVHFIPQHLMFSKSDTVYPISLMDTESWLALFSVLRLPYNTIPTIHKSENKNSNLIQSRAVQDKVFEIYAEDYKLLCGELPFKFRRPPVSYSSFIETTLHPNKIAFPKKSGNIVSPNVEVFVDPIIGNKTTLAKVQS